MPLLLLAYLAFVSMALPDNVPSWPSVRLDLDQPLGALGLLVPFGVAGYVVSSSATGFLLARMGVGWLLAWSTALSAAALAVYAAAGAFWVVLACVFFGGITSGAVDSTLNAYAASNFGARHISWLHASFCLGAMLGPAAFVLLLSLGATWRWTYAGLATGQALLAIGFGLTARRWTRPPPPPDADRPSRKLPAFRVLWPSLVAFAVQDSIEAGISIWAFIYLTEGRGMAIGPAGLTVSAYWAMMLAGRVAVGHWAERVGTQRVVAIGVAGMLLGAVVAALPGPLWLASVGVGMLGLACAPMFPLLTLTTADRVGKAYADRVIGLQMAISSTAGAVIPGITIGVLTGVFGARVIGPFVVVLAAVMCLVYWRLRR